MEDRFWNGNMDRGIYNKIRHELWSGGINHFRTKASITRELKSTMEEL
jgi:hypothetical protein